MSSYRGNDLFGSGPHRFTVRGVAARTAEHGMPGADGVRRTPLGKSARTIDQRGTLIADDLAGLDTQRAAIEAAIDGRPGQLVDGFNRPHADVVLLAFDTESVRRVGPRFALDYTIHYEQVQP